jgi:hypothetical protein
MRLSPITTVFSVGLALVAIACGSSSSKSGAAVFSNPAEAIHSASARATDAKTASFTMKLDVDGGGEKFAISIDGAMDFVNKRAKFHMSGNGDSFDAIVIDGVMYIRHGNEKTWTKADASEALDSASGPLDTDFTDPTKALDYLKSISGDVENRGTEQIRGVDTAHYRFSVDLLKAAGNSIAAEQGMDAAALLKAMLGTTEVPFDVWLDGQGRPARLDFALSFDLSWLAEAFGGKDSKSNDAPPKFTLTMGMEFFDWGKAIDIQAPPAA